MLHLTPSRRLPPLLLFATAAAALTLLFFWRLAYTDWILGRGDTYNYFYPYWAARDAALRSGAMPLWSDDLFMGAPLLADSQVGTLYPPNWLTVPLAPPDAIRVQILLHVAWAVLGAALLARRTLRVGVLPALLAGALFGLGGYAGAHVEQINQLQGIAWLPWLFLLLETAAGSAGQGQARRDPTVTTRNSGSESTSFANFASLRFLFSRRTAQALSLQGGSPVIGTLLLGAAWALQLLSGHTQTAFIAGVGMGVYALLRGGQGWWQARHADREIPAHDNASASAPLASFAPSRFILILIAAGGLALLLAAAQLIPTVELTALSNRAGGLTAQAAGAFSLEPALVGRGLLPSYDAQVFGEFVGYSGVIGLALAVIGAWCSRHPARWLWLALAAGGLVLALGLYTPLYWLLAALPGFNWFRVPARWLALFALGTALLAALGAQALAEGRRPGMRGLGLILALVGGLASSTLLADRAAEYMLGQATPSTGSFAGWGAALGFVLLWLWWTRGTQTRGGALRAMTGQGAPRPYMENPTSQISSEDATSQPDAPELHAFATIAPLRFIQFLRIKHAIPVLVGAALVELLLASGALPFNTLVPPEVYASARFTSSQLSVYTAEQPVPGRMLSITPLQFDPGDSAALLARYRRWGMNDLQIRYALVAIKRQETLAPNLPLAWGLPSVDGFGGGLLPTRYYTTFSALLLPPGVDAPPDGRLQETLALEQCQGACLPEQRWLDLMGVEFLITDKTYTRWVDGVAYDPQFPLHLPMRSSVTLDALPVFETTAVHLLYSAEQAAPQATPTLTLTDTAGTAQAVRLGTGEATPDGMLLARLPLDEPLTPVSLTIDSYNPLTIHAITLVDTRTGDFVELVPNNDWQRALSSDIKLYRRRAPLPRALLLYDWQFVPPDDAGDEIALGVLRGANFDPARTVVLAGAGANRVLDGAAPQGTAAVVEYAPGQVVVEVASAEPGWLLLADAYFPGWQATVNAAPAPIYRADIMFRAVQIPAGASRVAFVYAPWWYPGLLLAGGGLWLLLGVGLLAAAVRRARRAG